MRSFYIYMSTEVKQSKVHRNIKLLKKKKTEMKKKYLRDGSSHPTTSQSGPTYLHVFLEKTMMPSHIIIIPTSVITVKEDQSQTGKQLPVNF
jgi:arginine repressor